MVPIIQLTSKQQLSFSVQLMKIRKAESEDLDQLRKLFEDTINEICSQDYSKEQLKVWTAAAQKVQKWRKRIKSQYFIVAEKKNKILGFASLGKEGHVEMIYIHKDYQGKGIGKELLKHIEEKAEKKGEKCLFSNVSITAKPFFKRMGFSTLQEQHNHVEDTVIINFRMKKKI